MDWHLKQKPGVNEGYTALRLMGVDIYQSVVSRRWTLSKAAVCAVECPLELWF
jgi:hypothetical protein